LNHESHEMTRKTDDQLDGGAHIKK
jgi:hypothetical protein